MLEAGVKYIALVPAILVSTCSGAITLSCDSLSNATCRCTNPAGYGVQWYKNRIFVAECYMRIGNCSAPGYTFTVDKSSSIYTCSVTGDAKSACDEYTCTDIADTTIQKSDTFSFENLTNTPVLNEPARNHMNGSINTTTDCLYKMNVNTSAMEVQYFAVMMDGVEKRFEPQNPVVLKDSFSCHPCARGYRVGLHVGFHHEENGTTEAKIRIVINYGGIKLNTTSENKYFINVANDGNAATDDDLPILIIMVILVAICVAICVTIIVKKRTLLRNWLKAIKDKQNRQSTIIDTGRQSLEEPEGADLDTVKDRERMSVKLDIIIHSPEGEHLELGKPVCRLEEPEGADLDTFKDRERTLEKLDLLMRPPEGEHLEFG